MTVMVLRNQHQNFGDKLVKEGAQNFNAGFVKPTQYNIFS